MGLGDRVRVGAGVLAAVVAAVAATASEDGEPHRAVEVREDAE